MRLSRAMCGLPMRVRKERLLTSKHVDTPSGPVIGFEHVTPASGKKSHVFLGIPYAQPPVGPLRFEKPRPYPKWRVPMKAWRYSLICPPHCDMDTSTPYCEDCLTVNVMRPSTEPEDSAGFPVALWFHASGFSVGSSQWCNYENVVENFVDRGVVVVTFNYRVGFFGFASTGDEVMPGNVSLFDMAAALEWTHKNIEAFGGNPEDITACGLSAGASGLGMLTMSPYSKNYIKKAIQLSGSVYTPWALSERTVVTTRTIAKVLGIDSDNSADIKHGLQQRSVREINDAMELIGAPSDTINCVKAGPRLDGDFLPADFHDLIKNTTPIPTLYSYTGDESFFFTTLGLLKSCNSIYIGPEDVDRFTEASAAEWIRRHVVNQKDFGEHATALQERVIDFYLNHDAPAERSPRFYAERCCKCQSHAQFFVPTMYEALERTQLGWPVFLLRNEFFADHHFEDDAVFKGAVHAVEQSTFFGFPVPRKFEPTAADLQHRNLYAESLCQFIKTGNPSSDLVPNWPRTTPEKPFGCVGIHTEPHVRDGFDAMDNAGLAFWAGLWQEFGDIAVRGNSYLSAAGFQRAEDEASARRSGAAV